MRARNLLGLLQRHHDEAGLTTVVIVDFKGNVLDKSRRVIADAPILAVFAQAPANAWQVTPFQVDWEPGPQQTLAERESELLEGTAYQTTASYDALNRIKQMQLPQDVEGKRHEVRPAYNRAGGLEQVRLDDTLYVERIAYDAKGQRALIAYGNGVMTRYAYDPHTFRLKRLRSERYSKPDDISYRPSGEALQDFGYDYDLVGNILAISDRAPGSGILNNPDALGAGDPVLAQLLVSGDALNRRFDYDPIYRLLAATGRECDRPPEGPPFEDRPRSTDLTKARAYTEQYRYDAMGNMLRLEHHSGGDGFTRVFTVETANNRLREMKVGDSPFAYTFDANGNMRSETTSRHFEWNHADQMKAFRTQTDGAEPSVYAHYLYDAAGQRVKKLVRKQGGQVEVTHYIDGVFEHHRWGGQSQAGENNHVHVMDDKQRIALVRFGPAHPDDRGPAVQFHLGDHLGSSNVVVNSAGALVNREEFTPFGETSFGSFAKKRYRFTGKERDGESGFTYHGARYYSPPLARWLSCDPRLPQNGGTLYAYVSNRPVVLYDPTGEDEKDNPTAQATIEHETRKWSGEGAVLRYDTLGQNQTKIQNIIDRGDGCAACHISTAVHNRYGRSGLNPANGLPWDWAINMEGFNDWVTLSVISRAIVELGTGTAEFGVTFHANTSFGALNNARASEAELVFYRPPNSQWSGTPEAGLLKSESDLFRRSVSERTEYSRSFFDSGDYVQHSGNRLSVSIESGPGVSRTLHTHPTSKVALPSGGDIAAYRTYPPNTVHEILGDKWPTTRSTLVEMGLPPGPLAPLKWRGRTGDIPAKPEQVKVSKPSRHK